MDIEQSVLEALRMGNEPDKVRKELERLYQVVGFAVTFKPDSQVAKFYQAIQDAKFRP